MVEAVFFPGAIPVGKGIEKHSPEPCIERFAPTGTRMAVDRFEPPVGFPDSDEPPKTILVWCEWTYFKPSSPLYCWTTA